jgi:3-dehydroquinate dehydratase-2
MKSVLALNGRNINLLGTREPTIYGSQTIADVKNLCRSACEAHGYTLDFRQSNHEGVLIDWIHEAGAAQANGALAGVVFNGGSREGCKTLYPKATTAAQSLG